MARVKPLRWRRNGKLFIAKTAHGHFAIIEYDGEGFYVGMCRGSGDEFFGKPQPLATLNAAKAWAERQHEKEVRRWLM